ncbi:MAG TPA: hypothetical protein VIM50_05950 [Candidatus Limnocylindria bacterium]|jgi:hypothetical protein
MQEHERIAALGRRCRLLEAGLDNSDNDPELIFGGVPYGAAMLTALRDPAVARAMAQLPATWRWSGE